MAGSMFVIGLTGGIGTGKSSVSDVLRDLGAEVINADKVGHEVYLPSTPGWDEVVAAFGSEVVASDGTIDRRRLGTIAFSDPQALSRLNEIVHPLLRELLHERLDSLRERRVDVAVVEAALLVESIRAGAAWSTGFDEVWVVTAPEAVVIGRVHARTGLEEASIRARIASQVTDEERLRYADAVIDNNGTLVRLRDIVTTLWHQRVPHGAQEKEPPV